MAIYSQQEQKHPPALSGKIQQQNHVLAKETEFKEEDETVNAKARTFDEISPPIESTEVLVEKEKEDEIVEEEGASQEQAPVLNVSRVGKKVKRWSSILKGERRTIQVKYSSKELHKPQRDYSNVSLNAG